MKLKRPKNGYEYDLAVELATASMHNGLYKDSQRSIYAQSVYISSERFVQDYGTMAWLFKCRSKLNRYLKKQKS
jgi:hypothetical protein